ncbi:type II toxin-antitoxin system PemK/MazF family toxin [Helicobacter sp. MIT 14-3879]|uniref:type II toxin-antitoxin system PemK/MazF family toxin n=1 Tax=Helicobacter sp. MIT 14-3879 TaxID=2040649 RepID=UPI000E1F711A|nr:type II toxin-antitoxin system PemK/MazF family toxin [Helicobacter sp. MIT 14-3879]RDU65532.1 toxin-antitoxin system protein [Helicobacter sp. MIT 14-3879]
MCDCFDNWNKVKKDIHNKKGKVFVKEGCVYWVSIGQNIGCEVYGKGDKFQRPVLVIKVLRIKENGLVFIGIPLSSKTRKNNQIYHKITKNDKTKVTALLGQIRVFDLNRIINYHYKIDKEELIRIKQKFSKLFSPSS